MKLLIALLFLSLSGCAVRDFFDGLHQFESGQHSVPAYPDYIADEPCLWTEGGETWLIDKNGVHELK